MSDWYRLDAQRNVVPSEQGFNRRSGEWVVGKTTTGNATVSTVFLGLDHGYNDGPPVVFETLVFGGVHSDEQERYCTWPEAEAGHARWVARVQLAQACAFSDVEVSA
jgi:hypothetical protein